MINTGTKQLHKQLEEAQRLIKSCRDMEEKVALANYIGNMYCSLICMGEGDVHFDKRSCFGNRKNYNKFLKKLDIYSDKIVSNFIKSQSFHKEFLSDLVPDVEDELATFCTMIFGDDEDDTFSKSDFLDLFSEFMRTLGLHGMFDDFYKHGKIYSCIIGSSENNLGFTLHNPVCKTSDIFIKELEPTIGKMNTLAHEFGHAYDLSKFSGDVSSHNQYFYTSFFGEVIPRLFERLLLRFLLANGIKMDAVRDKFIDFEAINFDYLLDAYIFSLLDDSYLRSGGDVICDSEKIYNMVKPYFYEDSNIKGQIERLNNTDLCEVYNYAYGDIISLFLCDKVSEFGFSNDMMEYFLSERAKLFDREFLEKGGFTPEGYVKLYKKEAQLIKK